MEQHWRVLRKKERRDETHFTNENGGKFSLGPSYFALYNSHSQFMGLMPYYAETGRSRPLIVRLNFRSQLFRFVKLSFPVYGFDALLC